MAHHEVYFQGYDSRFTVSFKKLVLFSVISLLAAGNALAQGVSKTSAETVVINGIRYELNSGTKTAKVLMAPNGSLDEGYYSGDIVIPEKVNHGTTDYTVTEIGDNAFESQFEVISVDMPATINKVGMQALYKNINLKTIICRAVVPPTTSTYVESFDYGICYDIPLYVPAESVDAYKTTEMWSEFRTILPLGTISAEVNGLWYYLYPDNTASVIPSQNDVYQGDVTIDSKVTDDEGIEYTVNAIGDYAFAYQTGMTSVTIPETVESYGSAVFEGCSGLSKIVSESATPPAAISATTDETYFDIVPTFDDWCFNNVELNVPVGSLDDYKSAEPWSNFTTIIDNVITSITVTPIDNNGILINGNMVHANGKPVSVYDMAGRRIYEGNKSVILQQGVYIIKTGDRTIKVRI